MHITLYNHGAIIIITIALLTGCSGKVNDGPELDCKQQLLQFCDGNASVTCDVHNSPALVWRKDHLSFNPPLAFGVHDTVGKRITTYDGVFVASLTKRTENVTESVLQFNVLKFKTVNISCGNVETSLLNTCTIANVKGKHAIIKIT